MGAETDFVVADVVFVIEATAINGDFLHELKTNYIWPTMQHFTNSSVVDNEHLILEKYSTHYGIVTYGSDRTSDLLAGTCASYGPFAQPHKVMEIINQLPLTGGSMDACANMAEGFATAHSFFDDITEVRKQNGTETNLPKHCILISNSPPLPVSVTESGPHVGKNVEQLISLFHERKINFSIIASRKMPILYKLYSKANGEQPAMTLISKNTKHARHLVLLKGYNLKERSPSPNSMANNSQQHQMVAPNAQMNQMQAPNQPSMPMDAQPGQQVQSQQPPNIVQQPGNAQGTLINQQQQQQAQFANNQTGLNNSNFQPNATAGQNRWLFANNQQAQQCQPRGQFIQPGTGIGTQQQQQNPNSALISQLSAPPNQSVVNPMLQQQQQMRMQMLNQQQQQQQQHQQHMQQTLAQQQQQGAQQGQQQQQPNVGQQLPGNQLQNQVPVQPQLNQQPETAVRTGSDKIWSGTLEWVEKSKPDQQRVQRSLQCSISSNPKDGEPELKTDNWPPKLIMQLMPKHLVGNIGGQFLKDSRMVIFRPVPCEALDFLSKAMNTGCAGCVHFTPLPNMPQCEIKVLILLYTPEKNAYLGFIPNHQSLFVERLRKVIQQKQLIGNVANMQQQQQQQQGQQQVQQVGQPPQLQNTMSNVNAMMQGQQQQQQQKSNSMDMQQHAGPMQPDGNQQQQQQQHYNQYAQQLNMQMPGGVPGGVSMQQQMSMMQQQQQRMPMAGGPGPGSTGMVGPNPNMQPQLQLPANVVAMQQQQQRMARPMMNNNPGLRHLLQQQSAVATGNQFRPQMGGPGGIGAAGQVAALPGMVGGGSANQMQQMGPTSGAPMGSNRFDDGNYEFM